MDPDVIIFLVLALIVLFCFTIFMIFSYSGLFYEPRVSTGEPPWRKSFTLAYRYITGPYNGNDVGATFTEVTCLTPKAIPVGIFYDNPREVESSKLRCVVGCIIKDSVGDKDNARSLVTDEELNLLKEKEFKFHTVPVIDRAVLSEFVYTTPFSIWLAPNRVYPRLSEYIADLGVCAYPMVEVYEDCKIKYAAPLSKQSEFFVPECSHDADVAEESAAVKKKSVIAAAYSRGDDNAAATNEKGRVTTLGENDVVGGGNDETKSDDESSFEEIGDEELMKRKSSTNGGDRDKKND